ncbi:hypothetical protein [Enterobacter sp. UPMP2052]
MTPARYKEVIGKGVCAGIWRRRAPLRYLASVSQEQVLNRFHTGVMFWWSPPRCAKECDRQPGSVRC